MKASRVPWFSVLDQKQNFVTSLIQYLSIDNRHSRRLPSRGRDKRLTKAPPSTHEAHWN